MDTDELREDVSKEFGAIIKPLRIISWIAILLMVIYSFAHFGKESYSILILFFLPVIGFILYSYFNKKNRPIDFSFPYIFKSAGKILLFAGLISLLGNIDTLKYFNGQTGYQFKEVTIKYMNGSDNLIGETKYTTEKINLIKLISYISVFIGSFMIMLSKEKNEDERIEKLRLLAYRDMFIAIAVIGIGSFVYTFFIGNEGVDLKLVFLIIPSIYFLRLRTLKEIL